MIVSYEGAMGGLLLREVETEQEAFAEMRRYLEVNNIPSNYTEVYWKEADERFGIVRHKRIVMGVTHDFYMPKFGIYYEGQPKYLEFKPEEKRCTEKEKHPCGNAICYHSPSFKHQCWYDEVAEYFRDLAKRKEGGE